MSDPATSILRTHLDDRRLYPFLNRLLSWLSSEADRQQDWTTEQTESRAKALLRAADAIDLPTLRGFSKLMGQGARQPAARVAVFDLLRDSGLAQNDTVNELAAALAAPADSDAKSDAGGFGPWIVLGLGCYAWKHGYPFTQLDPASPPDPYSPAGMVVKQTASFIRRQVQRSATERDRLARSLAFAPGTASQVAPSLEELEPDEQIAPIPPHFRPPVPVTYPEMSSDTLRIEAPEADSETSDDLGRELPIPPVELPPQEAPQRMPPIRITAAQVAEQARPGTRVVTSTTSTTPGASFAHAVRHRFRRGREPFASTKLKVIVQERQDGPGFHGLQVRVTCHGVRNHVAGTTDREGIFICSLPVRVRSGLTYDVDVTWPRELGGEIERKSVTLNADRTIFSLPFYRHHL